MTETITLVPTGAGGYIGSCVGARLLDETPEIVVIENPREFETVTEDFTVETATAHNVIGFDAERTVVEAVREMCHA